MCVDYHWGKGLQNWAPSTHSHYFYRHHLYIKSWMLNIEFLGFLRNPGWGFSEVRRRDGQMSQEADFGSHAREREERVRTAIPAAPSCTQSSAIHPAQLILCSSSFLGGCPQNTNPHFPHFHFSAPHPSHCRQAALCVEEQLNNLKKCIGPSIMNMKTWKYV